MSDYTPTIDEIKHAALTYTAIASEAEWDRALAAHDAEVRAAALAEQGTEEWEYGTALRAPNGVEWDHYPHMSEADARAEAAGWLPEDSEPDVLILVKRTPEVPAGPWVPVEEPNRPDGSGEDG